MFPLEQIMPLIPDGHIITILDSGSNRVFTAGCPAMIPFQYRDKMVLSIIQGANEVMIKLYLVEVSGA